MNFAQAAQREYRNYRIFSDLARVEQSEHFKDVLKQLADYEDVHYKFWVSLEDHKKPLAEPPLWFYRLSRRILGLTFVLKQLELKEDLLIEEVREYLFTSDHPQKKAIEELIYVEEAQEQKLLKQIKEERVEFTGSIVLGLNDGLIELSGALTGFSFAFRHNATVVLAGFILGISASLSMASSAYLQARQEKGKDPKKAAMYVGLSYFVVLGFFLWPYAVFSGVYIPIALMILTIILLVAGLSYYTSVIFNRDFRHSFLEMFAFSIGTAIVTFLIGSAARHLLGIQI